MFYTLQIGKRKQPGGECAIMCDGEISESQQKHAQNYTPNKYTNKPTISITSIIILTPEIGIRRRIPAQFFVTMHDF